MGSGQNLNEKYTTLVAKSAFARKARRMTYEIDIRDTHLFSDDTDESDAGELAVAAAADARYGRSRKQRQWGRGA